MNALQKIQSYEKRVQEALDMVSRDFDMPYEPTAEGIDDLLGRMIDLTNRTRAAQAVVEYARYLTRSLEEARFELILVDAARLQTAIYEYGRASASAPKEDQT